MVRNGPMSGKSGSQHGPTSKKQIAHIEFALKVQGSSEAVRSKMRKSLAAALASHKKNNASTAEEAQNDSTDARQVPLEVRSSDPNSTPVDNIPAYSTVDGSTSKESAIVDKTNACQEPPVQLHPSQYDDLLQGNGLSWAFDFDSHMMAEKEAQNTEMPQPLKQEAKEQRDASEVAVLTPEDVAFEIETELFKLFGGVNKKYKEKGRSLLFNLKDPNNPELRERVISGEISPERLCSMSAEELASKELSQWRMAKAEEFAQMVVLPDTEVNVRHLVKKTHKGEYQVEVNRVDDIAAEVSGGIYTITQSLPKTERKRLSPSLAGPKDNENVAGQEISSGDQDLSGSLIIPTDGTDLMQGMIVDELKDAEFPPPIVSLDEFMESLNSEPPFGNLSTHAGKESPVLHEPIPKAVKHSRASDYPPQSPNYASSKKLDAFNKHEIDLPMKSTAGPAKQNIPPGTASKAEFIWEGDLQLHVSTPITVGGLFQSGEKTSTKEWATSVEIKGTVRLDAFEKFLQELPMSRTRAVMILLFDVKDKLSEKERSNFSEAIDSFVADERLGFVEPAPGVELYLCPQISRIIDMLNKHLPTTKERLNADNNSIENTLIDVVVWRRSSSHMRSKTSPNSSSKHHNLSLKNLQHTSPSSNVDLSSPTPTRTLPPVFNRKEPPPQLEDEDDDIPPGFGPVAAKDDDDLPEFNFSCELNLPSMPKIQPQNLHCGSLKMTQKPVDQVRELIQKYGQNGTTPSSGRSWVDNRGLGFEPWNEDEDDDDIPEWRPQHMQHQQQSYSGAYGHRPPLPAHLIPARPCMVPMASQQPPPSRWPQPQAPPHRSRWRQH